MKILSHGLVSSIALIFSVIQPAAEEAQETLPPLIKGEAPQTLEGLWRGFDPRAEPLDVEVLKEWEEDGVILKIIRYRIGIFKGQKSMMAAIYGYPKGARSLPGLVQIHGGGQYADHRAVLTNAKRGYATISISWAGRISAPDYKVGPPQVKLFWDKAINDPGYRVTTDWAAIEAYHAPSRHPQNVFPKIPKPASWTLDAVRSPRNNSWFLCALGARRALTFLEQQAEVNPEKLGVYGHSMGGKLTVMTTGSDARVKASAPSCGGVSDRSNTDSLFRATIGDDAYLKRITCPIFFLSPANDFHGRINDLQTALTEIQSNDWRVTCAPHHNHQDTANYEVATQLWFDEHLKGTFQTPKNPVSKLQLGDTGVPVFTVMPDRSKPVVSVDIFYSQQGQIDGAKDDMENTKNRFWHYQSGVKKGGEWASTVPHLDPGKPLWIYANVVYKLEKPIVGAGYYYGTYEADQFTLSTRMVMLTPAQLKAAGAKKTSSAITLIEDFIGEWEKEWFTYRPGDWGRKTHKVYDARWQAPGGATMAFEVRSEVSNKLVVGLDHYAAEIEIPGGESWHAIQLKPVDFKDADGNPLASWDDLMELRLGAADILKSKKRGSKKRRSLGGLWKGRDPNFKNLRWEDR